MRKENNHSSLFTLISGIILLGTELVFPNSWTLIASLLLIAKGVSS